MRQTPGETSVGCGGLDGPSLSVRMRRELRRRRRRRRQQHRRRRRPRRRRRSVGWVRRDAHGAAGPRVECEGHEGGGVRARAPVGLFVVKRGRATSGGICARGARVLLWSHLPLVESGARRVRCGVGSRARALPMRVLSISCVDRDGRHGEEEGVGEEAAARAGGAYPSQRADCHRYLEVLGELVRCGGGYERPTLPCGLCVGLR